MTLMGGVGNKKPDCLTSRKNGWAGGKVRLVGATENPSPNR